LNFIRNAASSRENGNPVFSRASGFAPSREEQIDFQSSHRVVKFVCLVASTFRRFRTVVRRALPRPDLLDLRFGFILVCRPAARPHSGGDAELRQQPRLQKDPNRHDNHHDPYCIHKHLSPFPISGSDCMRNYFIRPFVLSSPAGLIGDRSPEEYRLKNIRKSNTFTLSPCHVAIYRGAKKRL
jgi:hypothetical protein